MHIIWKWGSSNFKAVAVLTFRRFSLPVVKLHAFSGGTTGQTGNAILGHYQASARQLLTTNLSLPGTVTTRCWMLSPWQFIGQTSLHCTFLYPVMWPSLALSFSRNFMVEKHVYFCWGAPINFTIVLMKFWILQESSKWCKKWCLNEGCPYNKYFT